MKVKGTEKLTVSKSLITIYRADSRNVDDKSNELTTYQKLELIVSPLKIGFYHTIDSCFERPVVPKEVLKDGAGRVVNDRITGDPKIVENMDDPSYRKAHIKFNRKIDALRVRDALRNDENVEFDETRQISKKTTKDNEEIAVKLLEEIEEFGFTEDEVVYILNKSEELTLVADHDDLTAIFCPTPSLQDQTGDQKQSSKTASDSEESTQTLCTVGG